MRKYLTLVKPETATGQSPPHPLGKYGRSLWDRMAAEYNVSDGAGIEMLYQACAAAQIAEMLQPSRPAVAASSRRRFSHVDAADRVEQTTAIAS